MCRLLIQRLTAIQSSRSTWGRFESFKPFNRYAPFITGMSPFQMFQSFNRVAPFKWRMEKYGGVGRDICYSGEPVGVGHLVI